MVAGKANRDAMEPAVPSVSSEKSFGSAQEIPESCTSTTMIVVWASSPKSASVLGFSPLQAAPGPTTAR